MPMPSSSPHNLVSKKMWCTNSTSPSVKIAPKPAPMPTTNAKVVMTTMSGRCLNFHNNLA
ncbi:hypothetical protein THIOM_003032 [Candidatus Thiomargarita nelsonii]|uniref:Uncharacterized protein n=1 Tax=Candidatus Thiomargarita nelsonii TaxID=1003181 RepID=A0A176RZN3_9GAMM|nr:hypothetical protein THIOM_003032 [Candidatus Thiomargarita nelsonii]